MGSIGSKLLPNPTENSMVEVDEKGTIPDIPPTTPIQTPKVSRKVLDKDALDPRSPSKHLARTPLEILSAVASRLSTLSIDTDQPAVETPLKRHLILGIDPRSPTLELQRTPIVVPKEEQLLKKIKNKNLEKVKNSAMLTSPPQNVPPKLLESNLLTPKIKSDAYKRKSFVLLETNVDFTETDLDTVINAKYPNEDAESCEDGDDKSATPNVGAATDELVRESEEELVETNYIEEVGAEKDSSLEANIEATTSNECETVEAAIEVDGVLEVHVPENDEILPEEDQKLIEDIINDEKYAQENLPIDSEENIEIEANQATKSAPVTPPSIVAVTPKKSKSQPITPPLVNLTANVEELNKKLTNLIYEDEDLVVFPRVVKPKDQSRTPLAQRNLNEHPKLVQKLKVSDKPRKGEYTVTVNSKIPVFKDKKIKVQCENTPPRHMRVAKPKKPQWDAKDDTMLI